jgi:hypothetical protein
MTADEVWNCVDSACAKLRIHELWRGRVTKAHGRFADARGGRISGGGSLSVDAATFDVTGVDATLVIHPAGDDHAVAGGAVSTSPAGVPDHTGPAGECSSSDVTWSHRGMSGCRGSARPGLRVER